MSRSDPRAFPHAGTQAELDEGGRVLWKSDEMLKAILESASQAILSVDREGRIVLANARTEAMFGYGRDELLGQPVEMLLPTASRDVHKTYRADYFSKPRVRPMGLGFDLAGHRKDGADFPVEISLSYVETEAGVFGIAFITDITERKRLEDQLIQSQKMEAVGRLAGGVAHDFNNMLTIISGYNRMLLDQLSTIDPLRGYAEEILKAADRAAALTNQLLAFSRRQLMQPRILDINSLIQDTEKMLRRLIGEDIELTIALRPDIGNIKADPGQIEQVIFNLAANARDAMPSGGRLTIETANVQLDLDYGKTHLGVTPGAYVMIAVSDTGEGMDAETKRRIFEPFFTTKERGRGTGLGLATVYGIVKQNGGDIWVYSEPSKGTIFKIYLPRVLAQADQAAQTPAKAAKWGAETILLVEDEQGVRHLIREMLKQQGYTILEATDGQEALKIVATYEKPIDLLLTDVVLPKISGSKLAGEVQTLRPDIKVLFISGYTENAIAHHGVLDSDVNFLSKPFTLESLVGKIRGVLQSDG
jgi:PAS domain S-box-containing protein